MGLQVLIPINSAYQGNTVILQQRVVGKSKLVLPRILRSKLAYPTPYTPAKLGTQVVGYVGNPSNPIVDQTATDTVYKSEVLQAPYPQLPGNPQNPPVSVFISFEDSTLYSQIDADIAAFVQAKLLVVVSQTLT
jgi:hypothetical protein